MRALRALGILAAGLFVSSFLLTGCASGLRNVSQITVSGSTTILPIAEQAAETFMQQKQGVSVLVSGLGSSAGIEAVSAGTAQIGTSSRDAKAEESNLGLVDTPIAYDGIAVIVNPSNPVNNLTSSQLRDIFAGKITNWKEVGGKDERISIVNRDEASGTREAFSKLVMKSQAFDPAAAVLPGTGQVRDVVARASGAIGYISLGFVKPRFTNVTVKAVSVDGVEPSEATVASGTYPIGRALHFFTKGQPTGLVKEYIDFVLSSQIQDSVVIDAGFIPIANGGKQ